MAPEVWTGRARGWAEGWRSCPLRRDCRREVVPLFNNKKIIFLCHQVFQHLREPVQSQLIFYCHWLKCHWISSKIKMIACFFSLLACSVFYTLTCFTFNSVGFFSINIFHFLQTYPEQMGITFFLRLLSFAVSPLSHPNNCLTLYKGVSKVYLFFLLSAWLTLQILNNPVKCRGKMELGMLKWWKLFQR